MAAERVRILVSNDDGYLSEGIQTLAAAMEPLGEVWVVAPDREQSAASHAISLHRPLRISPVKERWFSVDGTPTDCSYLAIVHLMKAFRPHLMVSGINHGANLADDVTYSGTVAAAIEASLLGIPAIAFSLVTRLGGPGFEAAGRFAQAFVRSALSRPLPPRMLLNVNIPGGAEPEGFVVTKLGKHSYGYDVVEGQDPRGRKYYWIGGTDYEHEDIPGSDCNAVMRQKRVSVTPLQLDLTHYGISEDLKRWTVEGFQRFEAEG